MLSMLGGPSHPAVSRRNPKDEYELLNRIGSGTYGEVYKVFYFITQYFKLHYIFSYYFDKGAGCCDKRFCSCQDYQTGTWR